MIELSNSKKAFLGKTADGRNKYSLDCSIGAVQFREKGQAWQDIDPSIEEADTGDFSIKTTQTPYLGRIGNDSRRRIYPDRTNLDCWIEFQKPYPSMGLPTRSDRWFYWDFTNATLGIRFDNTSVKFGFRLKNSSTPTSITIPFETQGITRQGRFLYHAEDTLYEDAIAELRKPTATDANGEERECEVTFGTGELTISLDTTGLTFPIEIDPTLDLQVGASADDAYEKESDGAMSLTGNSILHSSHASDSALRYWGAHRWTGVDIPEGATIDVAYAELYCAGTSTDDPNCNLHFQKSVSPAAFTTTTSDITGRTRTTESVSWVDLSIGTGWEQSPELKTALQEVIDNYSPTALVLITRPNQDEILYFYSYSYDFNTTYGAKLHIEYTAASNTILLQVAADLDDAHEYEDTGTVYDDASAVYHNKNDTAGGRYWGAHRWASGSLPSIGDTIDKCYIQLYSTTSVYDDIDGNWHFEELAAPAQFTAGAGNTDVTERDRTETSVSWQEDSLGTGWVQSPELKTALQEVINAYSPSALAAIFRPNQTVGDKRLYSRAHNSDSALAARIFIKWTPAGGQDYPISTASSLSLASSLARSLASDRGIPSNLSLTAALSRIYGRICTASANVSLTTNVSKAVATARATSSNLNLATTITRSWPHTIATSANLSLATAVDRVVGRIRTTASSLSLGISAPGVYESYNTGDDIGDTIHGLNWRAQTFTPSLAHTVTSVKLLLYRSGSPGTLTVSIRATDGSGHPTGGELCSGTTNGNTLTTDSAGEWREITLGAGYDLAASIKYAIVFRAPDGGPSDRVSSRLDSTSPTYAGGIREYSTDGGTSWIVTAHDCMFEEWGDSPSISRVFGGIRAISSNLSLAASVSKTRSSTVATSANLSLTTTISRAVAWARATTSNLSVAAVIAQVGGYLVAITAHLSLTTNISRGMAFARGTGSNLNVTTTIARIFGKMIATSSSLSLTVAISEARGFIRAISSSLDLTASISRIVAYSRSQTTLLELIVTIVASWVTVGRILAIRVITSQYRTMKAITSQYRKIKTLLLGE